MSSNTIGIIEMLVFLNNDCGDVHDIQEKTGLWPGTIKRYLRMLKKKKLIRAAEWKRRGVRGSWSPCYEWNYDQLPDTPKPKSLTPAERMQRCREKKLKIKTGILV